MPLIERVAGELGAVVSVDTYKPAVARAAIAAGACIVNDVSGHLWDATMSTTCAELGCGTILMHTRGRPHEWIDQPPIPSVEILPLVLDGLAELGRDGLMAAGRDLADQLTALHPGSRLSWRQIGAVPESPECAREPDADAGEYAP